MNQLIITADDYGLSEGVSRGILECLAKECITDVSFMVTTTYFAEAAALLLDRGHLEVGLHLCLVDGEQPLTEPQYLSKIVGIDRRFFRNRYSLLSRFAQNRALAQQQARGELRSQADRLLSKGFKITHLDTHQHLHLWPAIGEVVLELACEYDVPFVRVPQVDGPHQLKPLLNLLAHRLRAQVLRRGKRFLPFRGFSSSGHFDLGKARSIIEALPKEGPVELMVHPGYRDESTSTRYSHWGFTWEDELATLQDHRFRSMLDARQIELISFGEIQ